ncbi:MAG TPA: hypothetical protein VIZ62_00825 [Nitrososphaeraceae archaeon]
MRESGANMIARTYLALFLVATSIAIGTTTSIATTAFADKSSGSNGLEKADKLIHDHFGGLSDKDVKWHEGICQGEHSTKALDEATNGAGCSALGDPGNSDDHRKNPNNN